LERKDNPIRSVVNIGPVCTQAVEPFDVDSISPSEFYPWILPELPDEYKMGLIVGSSGSGKSLLAKEIADAYYYSDEYDLEWTIADAFDSPVEAHEKFYAVGLNSVPLWKKGIHELSTGERHRAEVAINLRSGGVIDEFTSVVDRDVAKSLCHSISRYIKNSDIEQMIFVTPHRDVETWLEPDWIIDTDAGIFRTVGEKNTVWWAEYTQDNNYVGKLNVRKS
jgi:ABC-type iron transport system FetAB ATPase subunit